MARSDHLRQETKILPVKSHSELLAKQYWLSCYQSHHSGHYLTSQPAPARNMKGTLSKFDRGVVPLRDDGISEVEQYRSALRNLHSQAVVDAQSNFVPESLELLRLNYYHSNATFLDPSALLLLSHVWVTAGSSTLTRPASPQAWQMFARTVEWHHTPLNICSSALHAQHNWQLKTHGTIQTRWLIFLSSTTADERRGAVGYNNNNTIRSTLLSFWPIFFKKSTQLFPRHTWQYTTSKWYTWQPVVT